MTSQYWMVMAWLWLWLAIILVATDCLVSLLAISMLMRLAWAILLEALLMLCWKLWAVDEASLWLLFCCADDEPEPLDLEYPPDNPNNAERPSPMAPKPKLPPPLPVLAL